MSNTTANNPQPERLKSCNYCRKTHSKCDGKQPCLSCVLHNMTCEYAFKQPRPRKPPKKEIILQSELLKLKSEYERLEHSEKYWKEKYEQESEKNKALIAKQEPTKVLFDTYGEENMFVIYASIYELVQRGGVFKGQLPTSFVKRVPELLNRMKEGEHLIDPKDALLLNLLLFSCYKRAGMNDLALQKLKKAIALADQQLSTIDLGIAFGLLLCAACCFPIGEMHRMKLYARTAKHMFEVLNERSQPAYRTAILLQLFVETSYKSRKQLLRAAANGASQDKNIRLKFAIDTITVHVELEKEGKVDIIKILQLTDKLKDPKIKQEFYDFPTFYEGIYASTLARALIRAGMKNTALQHVEKIRGLINQKADSLGPIISVLSLISLCDTHLIMGNWAELNDTIKFAYKLSDTFPVSTIIAKDFEHKALIASMGNARTGLRLYRIYQLTGQDKKTENESIKLLTTKEGTSKEMEMIKFEDEKSKRSSLELLLGPTVSLFDEEEMKNLQREIVT